MKEKQLKEFLQIMWCALNCVTSNDEVFEIMQLLEKHTDPSINKWQKYIDNKQDTYKTALKDMEKLLKSTQRTVKRRE